jgi:galactokinase
MSASGLFQETFGRAPAIVMRAHGRVNLIGEHVDYNGGLVLPTPIARRLEIAAGFAGEDRVAIASNRFAGVDSRAFVEGRSGRWSDYAFAAALKAIELGAPRRGLAIAIASDLPEGAGLSSSAATVVGVIRAALALSAREVDDVSIARAAQAVENDFIGVPCGIMDQMAVALARPGEALALDTSTLACERVAIPAGWRFAVIHSGETRALNDGRYALRRLECERAARAVGAEALCRADARQEAAIEALAPPLRGRARHALSEHRRTVAAVAALRAGNAAGFGRLMDESHASMRDDFEVTTPLIDAEVEASRAAGALGARMTGGGFGGCVVSLIPPEREEGWAAALAARFPGVRFIA